VLEIAFSFSIVSVKEVSFLLKLDSCNVKMSVVTYNQPCQLSDDVLPMIFDKLDDQDLLRCEAVCRQWHNVSRSGRVWKDYFIDRSFRFNSGEMFCRILESTWTN